MLIVILTDPFILVMNPTRPKRIDGAAESGTLYHPNFYQHVLFLHVGFYSLRLRRSKPSILSVYTTGLGEYVGRLQRRLGFLLYYLNPNSRRCSNPGGGGTPIYGLYILFYPFVSVSLVSSLDRVA